jgi:hypothetical protein
MVRGSIDLAVVAHWFRRNIRSQCLSITIEADLCTHTVENALELHGTPSIFNRDKKIKFMSVPFCDLFMKLDIKIGMDDKG